MNSSSDKSIIVICKSDTVLIGLSEILKGSLAGEVILLHRCEEIVDYPQLTGHFLVLAASEELEKSSSLIRQILPVTSNTQFLPLNFEVNPDSLNPSVNLFDSPALICFKVNEALHSFTTNLGRETDTELTRREIEVLLHIAKGFSNKEIADQLFISTHTVISHRKNISEKTGIKSASGMTMYAILKKIIDVNDIDTADLI
jgi:DNA-binding CsgD family transcriptional regulator